MDGACWAASSSRDTDPWQPASSNAAAILVVGRIPVSSAGASNNARTTLAKPAGDIARFNPIFDRADYPIGMAVQASRPIPADIVTAARRIEQRGALRLPSNIHSEAGLRAQTIVTDVTTRGCRLELAPALPPGSYVTIIVRSTLIGGRIMWCEHGVAGVEFGARLLPKTLRLMLSADDAAGSGSEAG